MVDWEQHLALYCTTVHAFHSVISNVERNNTPCKLQLHVFNVGPTIITFRSVLKYSFWIFWAVIVYGVVFPPVCVFSNIPLLKNGFNFNRDSKRHKSGPYLSIHRSQSQTIVISINTLNGRDLRRWKRSNSVFLTCFDHVLIVSSTVWSKTILIKVKLKFFSYRTRYSLILFKKLGPVDFVLRVSRKSLKIWYLWVSFLK